MHRLSPLLLLLLLSASSFSHARATSFTANVNGTFTDWDKRQTCTPSNGIHQPSTVEELRQIVTVAEIMSTQIKTVGSGHSFSQITLTDDGRTNGSIILNLDNLNKVLKLPTPDDLTVTVEAGIRVHDLNAQLLVAGYALTNTGAIAIQSIAGATQTGTHGTGVDLGSMSSTITSLDLLLANGTVATTSITENPNLFKAVRVGLGALGIVVRVTLQVVPKFKLHRVAMPYPLDQLMVDLPRLKQDYARLQWYWTPYTNNATLLLRIPVDVDAPIVPCWPGDVELSAITGKNVTCTDWSFKALCHEADDAVLYTEMEMFVDQKHCANLVQEFQTFQRSVRNQSQCAGTPPKTGRCSLFTGVRYGKADSISWMSQMYQRDICVISNIVLGTTDVSGPPEEFALYGKQLETIAQKYGARPHWGKMHWFTGPEIAAVYPEIEAFKQMRAELDPNNMFVNDYLRRVLGLEQEEASTTTAPTMPTVTLSNGIRMPVLAAGVGGDSVAQTTTSIQAALQAGFTSIDTAHDYDNFAGVAAAIAAVPRASYFLTSKVPGCGVPTQGLQPPCYNNTLALAHNDVDAMKVDYVDLLLLHFPPLFGCRKGSSSCTKMQQQWSALEQFYRQNKTRAIGVSNYCTACLQCLMETATVAPMVNQMETHLGIPSNNHGLRPFCHTNNIVLEAYSPLAHGKVLHVPELVAIAATHNKTTAQIALRYVLQLGGSDGLSPFVTSSSNPTHLAEDLDVVAGGWSLTLDDMMVLGNVTDPSCSVEAPGGCCSGG